MQFEEANNPILQKENYFKEYQQSIENLKNDPRVVEFDRLCFELFEANEMGKRFLVLVTERYLLPTMANRQSANYPTEVLWAEGFKDFARLILGSVKAHQQRIEAGR